MTSEELLIRLRRNASQDDANKIDIPTFYDILDANKIAWVHHSGLAVFKLDDGVFSMLDPNEFPTVGRPIEIELHPVTYSQATIMLLEMHHNYLTMRSIYWVFGDPDEEIYGETDRE